MSSYVKKSGLIVLILATSPPEPFLPVVAGLLFRVAGDATSGYPRHKKNAAYWLPMRFPICCLETRMALCANLSSTSSKR